jgi:hypothetical protein
MRKRVSRWTTAQRVVIVVAWAGVLQALWAWLRNDGFNHAFGDNEGWFNYAPDSGVVFSPGGGPPWSLTNPTATTAIEIALVLLWLVTSFWLLGVRPVEESSDAEGDHSAD